MLLSIAVGPRLGVAAKASVLADAIRLISEIRRKKKTERGCQLETRD